MIAKFQGVSEKLRCILLVYAISMGEVENFEMEPEVRGTSKCGALPVGYNFVALVALIILFKNPRLIG